MDPPPAQFVEIGFPTRVARRTDASARNRAKLYHSLAGFVQEFVRGECEILFVGVEKREFQEAHAKFVQRYVDERGIFYVTSRPSVGVLG